MTKKLKFGLLKFKEILKSEVSLQVFSQICLRGLANLS